MRVGHVCACVRANQTAPDSPYSVRTVISHVCEGKYTETRVARSQLDGPPSCCVDRVVGNSEFGPPACSADLALHCTAGWRSSGSSSVSELLAQHGVGARC